MSETTFQDTPLYAWLRANAWFLLAGVALVGGILSYRNLSAGWSNSAREKSWNAFPALAGGDPTGPALSSRLEQAKADSRIYPWVVLESARQAAADGDQAALALLRPELAILAKDDSIRVATPGGRQGMASFMLSQLDGSGAAPLPQEFNSVEPAGRKVELVVSTGAVETYTVIVGLYEEQCPAGTAAFLQWTAAERLTGQSARLVGASGLTISLLKVEPAEGEAAPAPVLVERPYGLFHEEGVLSMLQLPGQFGSQDLNAVQLLLADQFQLDGQSTVLGKVTDGFAPLKAALELAGPSAALSVVSARVL